MPRQHEWIEELWDGVVDLGDDLLETFLGRRPRKRKEPIETNLYGTLTLVRPAYLFATRVNGMVKVIAGVSVLGSALLATVWGYASTKDLLAALVSSLPGRIVAMILGFSILIVGLWEVSRRREKAPKRAETPQKPKASYVPQYAHAAREHDD